MERINNLHNLLEDRETVPLRLTAKSRLKTKKPFPDLNTVRSPLEVQGDAGIRQDN